MMSRDRGHGPSIYPSAGRLMVFVDGENLVCRYQDMLKIGRRPKTGIFYIEDVAVWMPSFCSFRTRYDLIRVNYYTSSEKADPDFAELVSRIKQQPFEPDPGYSSAYGRHITPYVHRKYRRQRKSSHIDIKMTVDVLHHSYVSSINAVHLLTGDADYAPLIDEVKNMGLQVFVSAFSVGLSDYVRESADDFHLLDSRVFEDQDNGF